MRDGLGVVVSLVQNIQNDAGRDGEYLGVPIAVGGEQAVDGVLHPVDLSAVLDELAAHLAAKIQNLFRFLCFHVLSRFTETWAAGPLRISLWSGRSGMSTSRFVFAVLKKNIPAPAGTGIFPRFLTAAYPALP